MLMGRELLFYTGSLGKISLIEREHVEKRAVRSKTLNWSLPEYSGNSKEVGEAGNEYVRRQ